MRQKMELSARLDPTALSAGLAKGASRVMAETLATQFKDQFGRAILDQLKKELPQLTTTLVSGR
jgi:hypothetical protein